MSKGTTYDEIYAKLVLEYFMPNCFNDLKRKDKPDLQGRNIGIEVTTAIPRQNLEMDNLYSKLYAGQVKEEKAVLNRIKKNGGQLKKGILSHPGMNDNFKNILSAHKNKLDKLNSGNYTIFENQCLFITDWILASEEMLNQALNDFIIQQQKYKLKFDLIIVCVPSYLYVFNLLQDEFRSIKYTSDIQYKLANDAMRQVKE